MLPESESTHQQVGNTIGILGGILVTGALSKEKKALVGYTIGKTSKKVMLFAFFNGT